MMSTKLKNNVDSQNQVITISTLDVIVITIQSSDVVTDCIGSYSCIHALKN